MVVALGLVLLGYLVPHLVRSREELAQSRVDDRFSATLRVVATTGSPRRVRGGQYHETATRPYLHGPRRGTEAREVERPTTRAERNALEARRMAAQRAARAARISRRRAAARRRLVLTVVLLGLSLVGWLTAAATTVTVIAGILPTLLLAGVLVTGRQAARSAERNNAADRVAMTGLALHAPVRARAEHEQSVETEAPPAVAAEPVVEQPAAPQPASTSPWTPQPVPQPTYQLKATAPRRDVRVSPEILRHGAVVQPTGTVAPEAHEATGRPSDDAVPSHATAGAAHETTEHEHGERGEALPATPAALEDSPYDTAATAAGTAVGTADARAEQPPGADIDVDAVLARRRAVGA